MRINSRKSRAPPSGVSVTFRFNLAGNAFGDPQPIDPFPGTEAPSRVSVLDFLGTGTASIVWSSELPASVPGTDLSKEESTYWLLEVRAPLAGPDFSTQFLIPIYSRSGP